MKNLFLKIAILALFLPLLGCGSSGSSDNRDTGESGETGDTGDTGDTNFACTDGSKENFVTPDVLGNNYLSTGNNSAILQGDAIGKATTDNAELRRIIPVCGVIEGYDLGQGFVTKQTATSESFRLIIPVLNTSSEAKCILSADIKYLDDGGKTLKEDLIIMRGSTGEVTPTQLTQCIEAGSLGYFVGFGFVSDNIDSFFSRTEGIQVSRISGGGGSFDLSPLNVLPTSYAVNQDTLEIVVENTSSVDVNVVASLQKVIYLDNEGFPLLEANLTPTDANGLPDSGTTLIPAGTALKFVRTITYEGIVNSIRPVIYVDLPEG